MPLHLVTGPVNSGKTLRLVELLREAVGRGSAFYVVPNESIASELRTAYLSEANGPAAIPGNLFQGYSSFIRSIAGSREVVIGPHQSALLCMRILSGQRLKYFRRDRISFGIAKEAAGTIAAIKRNLISVEELTKMLETRGTLKEYDLLVLFKTYEIEKSRLGVIDSADLYAMAAAKIKEGAPDEIKHARAIIFDEFFAPEPGLVEILKLLRKSLPETTIALSLPKADHESQIFAARANEDIQRILKIADSHEELPPPPSNEATVSVLKTRSPIEECRFIVEEAAGRPGDEPVDTVLCVRRGHSLGQSFLEEIWRRDRANLFPRTRGWSDAPVLVEILDGPISDAMPRKGTIFKFAEAMMKEIRKDRDLEGWNRSLSAEIDRSEAARSFRAMASLDGILQSAALSARFLNVGAVSREAFFELVLEMISAQSSDYHGGSDALPVKIGAFEDGISLAAGKILIPGAVDGTFPAISDEKLFFTDQEELGPRPNRLLDDIFPSADARLAREAFLFHTWISKARYEVVITMPAVDESGSETIESGFLDAFGKPVAVDAAMPASAASFSPDFEGRIARQLLVEDERLEGSVKHHEYHGRLKNAKALDLIRMRYESAIFSPSQLETYAKCPFSFFVERVLGLKAPEDITREILPKDRGTIIHTILEDFYRNHASMFRDAVNGNVSEKEISKTIDELSATAFEKHVELIAESSPVLHPFQKRAIKTVVIRVIMKEIAGAKALPSPLFPKYCEWAFGAGEKPPLEVKGGSGQTVLLGGRIDRVDVTEDGRFFAVTDYKTGKDVKTIRKELDGGLHLQLPIYVKAVKELLLKDAVPLGGFLLSVMTAEKKYGFLKKEHNDVNYSIGKRISSLIGEEEWEGVLESALGHARKYASEICEGNFAPTEDTCPVYCEFADICRKAGG